MAAQQIMANRPKHVAVSRGNRTRLTVERLEDRLAPAGVVVEASTFDLVQFEQNIVDFLDGNVIGYAYAINKDGAPMVAGGADGDARTPADGQLDFATDTRIEVASVSKTVTAVAMLKLLKDQGISVNASIAPYLPTAWQANMGVLVPSIRFIDLLKHRSGLHFGENGLGPTDYDGLADLIDEGVTFDEIGNFEYKNSNYALMRVLIPYVLNVPTMWLEGEGVDAAAATGFWYKTYVQASILGPMGIAGADMAAPAVDPALAYSFPDDGQPGFLWDDLTETGGAFGWKLSVADLATFLDKIDGGDAILSQETIQLMRDEFLGFHDPSVVWEGFPNRDWAESWFGTYYGHGGDFKNGTREVHTSIYTFPGGIQAAVIMNSGNALFDSDTHQNDLLEAAYENAWTHVVIDGTSAADTFEIDTAGGVRVRLNGETVFRGGVENLQSLTINGLGGGDTFDIRNVPAPLEVTVNGNAGADVARVQGVNPGTEIHVNTGRDNDTVELSEDFGDLDSIIGIVRVDMGSGAQDEIIIHDYDHTGDDAYNIWEDHFDSDGFGHLYFEDAESVDLRASDGNNDIQIRGIHEDVQLTVRGGGGDDGIVAGYDTKDLDSHLRGGLTVMGGGGANWLLFDDSRDNVGNDDYSLISNSFTKPGLLDTWTYHDIDEVSLHANDYNNTITINTGVRVVVDMTINAGFGDDTINVGTGRADTMRADLHVNGFVGDDIIYINNQNAPGNRTYTFTGQTFDMSGAFFGSLSYAAIDELVLNAGSADDTVFVHDSPQNTAITVNANDGDDALHAGEFLNHLGLIFGDLHFSGGSVLSGGTDTVILYDEDNVGMENYTFSAGMVAKPDFLLTHAGVNHITLYANNDANTITVSDNPGAFGPEYDIYAGDGDDHVIVNQANSLLVNVAGGRGFDRVRLNGDNEDNKATIQGNTLEVVSVIDFGGFPITFDHTIVHSDDAVERRIFDGNGGNDLLTAEGVAGVNEKFRIQAMTTPGLGWLFPGPYPRLTFVALEDIEVHGNAGDRDRLVFTGTENADFFDINLLAAGTAEDPVVILQTGAGFNLLRLIDFFNVGVPEIKGAGGPDTFYIFLNTDDIRIRTLRLNGGLQPGARSGDRLIVNWDPGLFTLLNPSANPKAGRLRFASGAEIIDIWYLGFEEFGGDLAAAL